MQQAKDRSMNKEQVKSINHALKVLNEAASDSADEIRSMVDHDYKRLKNVLSEVKPKVKSSLSEIRSTTAESLSEAKEQVVTKTKETAEKVDHSAHENPWKFIGGAAALSALVGFLLGRKSSRD